MKRKKLIIPLMIVIVIVGIFIYKKVSVLDENNDSVVTPGFALDATYDFDLEELKSYNLPIIIDFGYESCPACKIIAPIIKNVNEKYQGRVLVKYVDIEKNQEAALDFPLRVVPTQFFFYADGTPYMPRENQRDFIVYAEKDTNEPVYTAHEGVMTESEFDEIIKELEAK